VLLHEVIHTILKVIHIRLILFTSIKKEILRRKD